MSAPSRRCSAGRPSGWSRAGRREASPAGSPGFVHADPSASSLLASPKDPSKGSGRTFLVPRGLAPLTRGQGCGAGSLSGFRCSATWCSVAARSWARQCSSPNFGCLICEMEILISFSTVILKMEEAGGHASCKDYHHEGHCTPCDPPVQRASVWEGLGSTGEGPVPWVWPPPAAFADIRVCCVAWGQPFDLSGLGFLAPRLPPHLVKINN